MICQKELSIEVTPAPFNCLGNAPTIQGVVWFQTLFGSQPPCGTIAAVAGVGTFSIQYNLTTCVDNGLVLRSQPLCNPGAAYDVTVTIPWGGFGSIDLGFPHTATTTLFINGLSPLPSYFDTKDLVTGPFTPFVVSGSLPNGASNVIEIQISLNALPNPSVTIDSAANLTITPLIPP